MKIDNYNYPKLYQPPPNSNIDQASYRQATAMSRESDISITTAQGDTVAFSQDFFSGAAFSLFAEKSANASMQTFTAASLTVESMGLEIQGDLNAEELSDIKRLFMDLHKIAKDFFQGDVQGAIKEALELNKHMDTITEFNASFTQTTVSSYSQNYHYLPNVSADFAEGFMEMAENKHIEDIISKILRSQWQQIAEILGFNKGNEKEPAKPAAVDNAILAGNLPQQPAAQANEDNKTAAKDNYSEQSSPDSQSPKRSNAAPGKHAQMMMDKLVETLERHPRLSPFALPLADKAIDKGSAANANNSGTSPFAAVLKNNFIKEFDDWLYG
jgi:hypothetical protein